jgi:hypothetical protein
MDRGKQKEVKKLIWSLKMKKVAHRIGGALNRFVRLKLNGYQYSLLAADTNPSHWT